MTDEAQLKKQIAAGKDADAWLNHPAFRQVITMMKAEYVGQFEATKFKDKEEREEIWRKLQALNGITNRMERIIRDAKNAEKTLLQKMKDKMTGN